MSRFFILPTYFLSIFILSAFFGVFVNLFSQDALDESSKNLDSNQKSPLSATSKGFDKNLGLDNFNALESTPSKTSIKEYPRSLQIIKDIVNPLKIKIEDISDLKNGSKDSMMVNLESSKDINLKIGEIGILEQDLSYYKIIDSTIEIISSSNNLLKARITPFEELKQAYLPMPRVKPKKGDEAIFRSFNNKAFLLAPSELSFNLISDELEKVGVDIINPDLLMGYISQLGKFDPSSKILKNACKFYSTGLVFMVGSKDMGVFSCQNSALLFKISLKDISLDLASNLENIYNYASFLNSKNVDKDSINDSLAPKTPFYTRIPFQSGGSLTSLFASKKAKNYFEFYDFLINKGRL